ncbi:MAG: hypothetical protein L6R39_000858 [Caloplaca ligustica]|nr:MAG: hypothetical protein L6R39_000858 [Caloplaca ligustica]
MTSPAITIFRGFPATASYIWSPFATKLEARLRFAGLKYKTEQGAPPKGPRGKIPYIALSAKGSDDGSAEMLADTALISERLVAEGLAEDLNAKLTPVEKATDAAVRALLEERLYFYQCYERWEQNYYTMRDKALAALPYPVRLLVGQLGYRKMSSALYGQGTGRLTPEEITKFKTEVWDHVNALLTASSRKRGSGAPDGMFFVLGGSRPTEADTTLFGFVASGLVCEAAPETQKIIRSLPTVTEYAEKIHMHYFPDYEHWDEG